MRLVYCVYASQCILILGRRRPQCNQLDYVNEILVNSTYSISWIDSGEYHCITNKMYNANSVIYLQIEWRHLSMDLNQYKFVLF